MERAFILVRFAKTARRATLACRRRNGSARAGRGDDAWRLGEECRIVARLGQAGIEIVDHVRIRL